MADLQLIESRLISGKGVLKLPSEKDSSRYFLLYADLVRPPLSAYKNFAYNPPRGRFANLVFLRNSYTLYTEPVEWENQAFDGIADISGQNLIAIKCMYKGLLQSFVNLGLALGANPVSVTDTIKNYESLQLSWDEIRISMYADTAMQFRLFALGYDACDNDVIKRFRPPPPPPPAPRVSAGTPISNLSPPYTGEDDDGNTVPFPNDSPPPPPGGGDGKYRVTWQLTQNGSNAGGQRVVEVWGPVGGFNALSGEIVLLCHGLISGGRDVNQQQLEVFPAGSNSGFNATTINIAAIV